MVTKSAAAPVCADPAVRRRYVDFLRICSALCLVAPCGAPLSA